MTIRELRAGQAARGRTGRESRIGRDNRVVAALRNPLYRSGYALVANTVGTTAIGAVYWAVATHLYSGEVFGRSSGLVAALILGSSIAQLNLSNTLPRFLPSAKRRAGRLILYSYGVTSFVALVGGLGFVFAMPRLNSQWKFLADSPQLAGMFVIAMVVWGVFALQDAALTGLRRAVVVPVENTVYGVLKLILLAAIASLLPVTGIFFSWIVPLAVCVPVINWLIFRRFLPSRETAQAGSEVAARAVVRHATLDYVGALFLQAYSTMPTLLVFSILGPIANGYFYIAWTISMGLQGIAANFGTSLLVEGAAAPGRLAELTRGVITRCLAVVVPGAVLMTVAAPLVLLIYGSRYAINASAVLALLALATIPRSFILVTLSLDRLAGRVGRAALTQAVLAVIVLGGILLLLRTDGIDGAAAAWLGANVLVAVARLPTIIGVIRRRSPGRHRMGAPRAVRASPPGPR